MTFQIEVENPCVIMSQDKSREFLYSGNNKDKFKVIKIFSFTPLFVQFFNNAMEHLCLTHVPFSGLLLPNANSCASQWPGHCIFSFLLNYLLIAVS